MSGLYIIFVGIILTITTGFGIAAFYPQPTHPEYPPHEKGPVIPQSCYSTPQAKETPECQRYFKEQEENLSKDTQKRKQYEEQLKVFQNKNAGYNRTAIFLGVITGAIIVALGLFLMKKSKIIATGLFLGGVLTAVLTRFIIMLASLGASVTGTEQANVLGFIEFGMLLVLSIVVIFLGLSTFKEEHAPAA